MKWRYPLILACIVIGICALLRSLQHRQLSYLTPQAAAELSTLLQKDIPALAADAPEIAGELSHAVQRYATTRPDREEQGVRELSHAVQRYATTGDLKAAPDILYIACLFKKTELVRSLLQNGADPNMRTEDGEPPLLPAVNTLHTPGADTQQICALVDTLLEAGATIPTAEARKAEGFLTLAAQACEDEQVILYLMDKGARPDIHTAYYPALHGWPTALARMTAGRPDSMQGLLHAVALGSCSFDGDYAACANYLLENGADINAAEQPELIGVTPLFLLAEALSDMPADHPYREQALRLLELLLNRGADPYRRADGDEEHPGFSPYDLLALSPGLKDELAARGIRFSPPALRFSAGVPLLADVCRAVTTRPTQAQLAPYFDTIAAVLSPTDDMLTREIYPQALEAAVALLSRADAARTADAVCRSPLWQLPLTRPEVQRALTSLSAMLSRLPQVALPPEFICRTAEELAAAGQEDTAAAFMELLMHTPDAHELIDRYCLHETPCLQAGAYAALLRQRGLPDARDKGVEEWLSAHHRHADTEFLRDALLLTSLERLWYGAMTLPEQQRLLALMRRIGAPAAAAAYEQIARHLDDPEALDTLMQRGDSWKLELEAATARYLLDHADAFTTPTP